MFVSHQSAISRENQMAFYTLIKVFDRSVIDGEFASDAEALNSFGAKLGDALTLTGDGAASYILGRKTSREDTGAVDTPVFSIVADDAIRSVIG
jgi:hypothetical protein